MNFETWYQFPVVQLTAFALFNTGADYGANYKCNWKSLLDPLKVAAK